MKSARGDWPRIADFARKIGATAGFASSRHVLVIPSWKVAYFRVPKAGNSAVKREIAFQLGLLDGSFSPTKDKSWHGLDSSVARLVTLAEFSRDPTYADYYSFAIVRHPLQRFLSCYRNKILRNETISRSFQLRGFRREMSLASFVKIACLLPDRLSDVHLASQSSILAWDGRLLPQRVIRLENIQNDWQIVRREVRAHCGVQLRKLRIVNATSKADSAELTPSQLEQVRRRYAQDYERFYPEERP